MKQFSDMMDEILEESAVGKGDSRVKRFKMLKQIGTDLEFFNDELGPAVKKLIDQRFTFNDEENMVMLEHYVTRAIRHMAKMDKDLKTFQKSLKAKIDFLKKKGD